MPSLNEEKNIENAINSTLSAFDEFNIDGEIIVINDGSTDKTQEIVEKMKTDNLKIQIINHDKPFGIGYSFFDGVKKSIADVVVMFPGDNENDPYDALSFFYLMNNVDIIVPFIHNNEVRHRFRRLISSIYRFIINMSFGVNLNYTNGTVFYRRKILDNVTLKSNGFFYQAELLIKLIRKGYLFAEVPNFLSIRNTGKSKATTLKSLIKVIINYLKLIVEIHIKRVETKKDSSKLEVDSVTYKKYSNLNRD
jgi:dolichol-phosphate mannosyltransferase